MKLEEEGQIASIELPDGWIEEAEEPSMFSGGRHSRTFSSPNNSEVRFTFFYRGYPVSEADAEKFSEALGKPPHMVLSAEFHSLSEILGNLSDQDVFKPLISKTDVLNGKTVLVVEGEWLLADQYCQQIFINADGSGTVVQEIFFQAPKLEYARHMKMMKQIFSAINWK